MIYDDGLIRTLEDRARDLRITTLDCHLQGHPERTKTPGVDMTTGLLGRGICVGAGLALTAKMTNRKFRTYILIGDG